MNDAHCHFFSTPFFSALGRQLNDTGTPTMFFTNGKRVPGAISVQELEKLLSENS